MIIGGKRSPLGALNILYRAKTYKKLAIITYLQDSMSKIMMVASHSGLIMVASHGDLILPIFIVERKMAFTLCDLILVSIARLNFLSPSSFYVLWMDGE